MIGLTIVEDICGKEIEKLVAKLINPLYAPLLSMTVASHRTTTLHIGQSTTDYIFINIKKERNALKCYKRNPDFNKKSRLV